MGFNDYLIKDIGNSASDFIVRYILNGNTISNVCPNPETDFTSVGVEITSGEYTTLSSLNDTITKDNDLQSVRPIFIIKISNINHINDSTAIAPIINIGARARGSSSEWSSNSSATLIWNFETSSWETLNDTSITVTTSGFTGSSISNVPHIPKWFRKKDFIKYIKNGSCYICTQATSNNSSNNVQRSGLQFRYIGLLFIKGNIWT
jgi:hypothetical protein